MKIYTKTGDKGTSGLFGGQRVPKTHPRLEAYGTVDELNTTIGLLCTQVPDQTILTELRSIQADLFSIGSILATPNNPNQFGAERVMVLEQSIDKMTAELPELKHFILPGGSPAAATAHIARAVCRRAERKVIEMIDTDSLIIQYLNRLSDWLFTVARYMNKQSGVTEQLWHSP